MTTLEKWTKMIRQIQAVQANYRLLQSERRRKPGIGRQKRMNGLHEWLDVIDEVCGRLKSRRGKSSARARRDWLVARAVEMMLCDGADGEQIRRHLTGPRPLNHSYVNELTESALREIMEEADRRGLFGSQGKGQM